MKSTVQLQMLTKNSKLVELRISEDTLEQTSIVFPSSTHYLGPKQRNPDTPSTGV